MKKTFALLLACLMLVAMLPGTAMAYEVVTPSTTTVPYTMTLTLKNAEKLPYNITYNFTAANPTIFQPAVYDADKIGQAVSGVPTISSIEFTTDDTFTNKECTKDLVINWTGVEIKEPGIYRWEITKTCEFAGPSADKDNQPSNNNGTFYLFAYVIDDNGTLKYEYVKLTSDVTLTQKITRFGDSYPATTLTLELKKLVQGTQGSKNQYFKFTILLKSPTVTNLNYGTITGHEETVPASIYHEGGNNATAVMDNAGNKVITLWLKHGQTATISDLLYNTSYTIIEEPAGYEVKTIAISGDESATSDTAKAKASDTALTTNASVTYTNEKNATVPTGISLHTAAPVMGILLAMSLLAILFVGKRKEYVA